VAPVIPESGIERERTGFPSAILGNIGTFLFCLSYEVKEPDRKVLQGLSRDFAADMNICEPV
jgi:hypothetical protein